MQAEARCPECGRVLSGEERYSTWEGGPSGEVVVYQCPEHGLYDADLKPIDAPEDVDEVYGDEAAEAD